MRKSLPIVFAAAVAAVVVTTPEKAKAGCWECWAGGAVVAGAVIAGSAYAHGYGAGYYGPHYGYGHYAPPPRRAATYGYYSPPYYDYGDDYYRPVRYVKKVRYVRQEYVEPVYYEPPQRVYYQQPERVQYREAPQQNWVRVRN